ncbi:MAG: helix-turn-helix transcriptional regulator [Planctomycetes bacterium]|nr:helix-turn-helix transcriptional regulator [Planctomycetota bacterium]
MPEPEIESPLELAAPSAALPALPSEGTFRMPSTALFLGLIPIFSGQARRGDLAAELLADGRPRLDRKGRLRSTQISTYIVYSGRESEARTSVSLFQDDPLWREGELSGLIKRQFGPSGLKHLLGIFIAAEENGASRENGLPGSFIFDVNRHLDILGYKRSNRVNGKAYHTTKHLNEAREIIGLLCSLVVVQELRLGTRKGSTVKVRLLLDEASAASWEEPATDAEKLRERITTNERFILRINPQLFGLAAEGTRAQQNFYTHQLKKLSRENAHQQALTLTLGVHLPIKFRMSGCMPLRYTARSFLRMAGIADEEYTNHEMLEKIEKSLCYMVDQGYVHAFETARFRYGPMDQPWDRVLPPRVENRPTETFVPTPRKPYMVRMGRVVGHHDALEEMWTVEAPDFLRSILANTLAKRAQQGLPANAAEPADGEAARTAKDNPNQTFLPGFEAGGPPPTSAALLKQARTKLGLSQGQLAGRLGVTQAAISMAEAGKRPRMAERLLDATRRLS